MDESIPQVFYLLSKTKSLVPVFRYNCDIYSPLVYDHFPERLCSDDRYNKQLTLTVTDISVVISVTDQCFCFHLFVKDICIQKTLFLITKRHFFRDFQTNVSVETITLLQASVFVCIFLFGIFRS